MRAFIHEKRCAFFFFFFNLRHVHSSYAIFSLAFGGQKQYASHAAEQRCISITGMRIHLGKDIHASKIIRISALHVKDNITQKKKIQLDLEYYQENDKIDTMHKSCWLLVNSQHPCSLDKFTKLLYNLQPLTESTC